MIRAEHVALALGLPLLFPLQQAFLRRPGVQADVLVTLPPERILPALRCGHGGALADLLEIRTVNYVFARLRPGVLLDREVPVRLYGAICTLDPLDPAAALRGSIMLSALADRPREARRLLERAIERVPLEHPHRWRLYLEVMGIHLTSLLAREPGDRAEHLRLAGEALSAMADQPGCPEPLRFREEGRGLIRNGLLHGLALEVAIWERRAEAGEGAVRERAEERRLEAEAMLRRERLQRHVDAFRRGTGRLPAGLGELKVGEEDRKDPLGLGYFLREGRVLAPEAERRALQRRLQAARDDWVARGHTGAPTLQELGVDEVPWLRADLVADPVRVDVDLELLRR